MRPLKKWASAVQLSQSKIEASKVVDVTGSLKYGRFLIGTSGIGDFLAAQFMSESGSLTRGSSHAWAGSLPHPGGRRRRTDTTTLGDLF